MQKRKKIFFGFVVSLIFLVIGFYLLKVYNCGYSISCYNLISISKALIYGMSALALVFLALLILPNAWPAWKKFAKWYIPIAALVFIFYQGPGAMDLFSPYPEQVYKWIGIIYVAVSAVIILFASAKNRK